MNLHAVCCKPIAAHKTKSHGQLHRQADTCNKCFATSCSTITMCGTLAQQCYVLNLSWIHSIAFELTMVSQWCCVGARGQVCSSPFDLEDLTWAAARDRLTQLSPPSLFHGLSSPQLGFHLPQLPLYACFWWIQPHRQMRTLGVGKPWQGVQHFSMLRCCTRSNNGYPLSSNLKTLPRSGNKRRIRNMQDSLILINISQTITVITGCIVQS